MNDASRQSTTIGAVFETRAGLERAQQRLSGAGVGDSAVSVDRGPIPGTEGERNLMDGLLDIFMPVSDATASGEPESHRLTVADLAPERRDAVVRALEDAGALHIYERGSDAGRWTRFVWRTDAVGQSRQPGTPRAVQPGFADTPPGFVPDPAPFPEVRAPGEPRGPDELSEPEGRFATQLDTLPDGETRAAAPGRERE